MNGGRVWAEVEGEGGCTDGMVTCGERHRMQGILLITRGPTS